MHRFFFRHAHRCHDHLEDAMWAMRHGRRGPGHGPFGFGFFGGEGLGGQGFRSGRKLGSGALQLVLLALLAERPSHGYELIKALEERSGGFYVPSPGMIYPALTWLEEVGYATVETEGAKKRYHISDAGRAYLAVHREIVDATLAQFELVARQMWRVREAFSGVDDIGPADVHEARHELRRALRSKRHVTGEEASRIAAILKRAAREILGDD